MVKVLYPKPKTKQELQDLIKDDNVIPNNIDTSLITDMSGLFKGNGTFNKPINKWNTKNVVNMKSMFSGSTSFNQKIAIKSQEPYITALIQMGYKGTGSKLPTEILGKISKYLIEKGWDTSNVINMNYMFCGATSFNQPVEMLDTRNVINTSYMFCGATSFNQPVEMLDTRNVTKMSYMLFGATSFNQLVEELDTSNVTNMYGMFYGATSFNQSVEMLDTSNAIGMNGMFASVTSSIYRIGRRNRH